MTKEDIIKLAREAGLVRAGDKWVEPARWGVTEIERFAALVATAEREACAKVCEVVAAAEREACAKVCVDIASHRDVGSYGMLVAHSCANEILARGQ